MAVEKSQQRIRDMFAAISPRYDLLNHVLSLGVDHYWRWQTARLVPADGDGLVLDLCTGTGDLAFAYCRRWGRGVEVVGADFCHEMLVRGVGKARGLGLGGRVRFVEADATRLPFPAGRFQTVCIAFGLRNVGDTQGVLAEMVRVAQPGGRVAVLEFSMPSSRPLRWLYGLYFRVLLPLIGQSLAPNRLRAYNYLPASVLEFPEGDAMLGVMGQCGLRQRRQYRLTFGIATLYVGTKPASGPPLLCVGQ